MLARVLVALAASVAAEKVKIGDIQTFHHAVSLPSLVWSNVSIDFVTMW